MAPESTNAQNTKHTVTFECDWKRYEFLIRLLAGKIKKGPIKFDAVFGIERGGLLIAVHLSHILKCSYLNNPPLYHQGYLVSPNVLIVDDVSDTGDTLHQYKDDFSIATLFIKPQTTVIPEYYAQVVPDDTWIIFPWEV